MIHLFCLIWRKCFLTNHKAKDKKPEGYIYASKGNMPGPVFCLWDQLVQHGHVPTEFP